MTQAYRASILYCLDEPARVGAAAYRYHEEGLLWVENGRVRQVGDYAQLAPTLPTSVEIIDYSGYLLTPGFIDTHVHYPQLPMIASYGAQLLDWLETYTFPTELGFAEYDYALQIAEAFLDELLRNGTTSALVFATVHPASVEAFFTAAQARKLRMIAGKVLMDRHAPAGLCEEPETAYHTSQDLIQRWHGQARLAYAVTPRFAPSCSPELLDVAGSLLQADSSLYLHTHLAESTAEVRWVAELFPGAQHYLDVYERAGLLGARSVLAHGIHLCEGACQQLSRTSSVLAHCPSSNLFLGSGLFPMRRYQEQGIRISLGTDVGAGTSFSMLKTQGDAYRVQQLQGELLEPMQAFYLATLGGARALALEQQLGSLQPGQEADFILLDPQATPLLAQRYAQSQSIADTLFMLNLLGDDRVIAATYILGELAWKRAVTC
ncbi:guanine deaminase [Nitrincola tapanii]|nr:guanine deaminase [Nitrincola tapanii]